MVYYVQNHLALEKVKRVTALTFHISPYLITNFIHMSYGYKRTIELAY